MSWLIWIIVAAVVSWIIWWIMDWHDKFPDGE